MIFEKKGRQKGPLDDDKNATPSPLAGLAGNSPMREWEIQGYDPPLNGPQLCDSNVNPVTT